MNPSVHVHVGSPAGACTVGSPSFFHYVLRLAEADITLTRRDRDALDVLAAVPNALGDDEICWGDGWRIIPAMSQQDWPVLEATPQRLRSALQTARRVLWEQAAPVGISAREIVDVENEIDLVLGVLQRAEAAGCSVNVAYVS